MRIQEGVWYHYVDLTVYLWEGSSVRNWDSLNTTKGAR